MGKDQKYKRRRIFMSQYSQRLFIVKVVGSWQGYFSWRESNIMIEDFNFRGKSDKVIEDCN